MKSSSSYCCLTEAPEYGEGLDPSEEDGGLAGHQRKDESIHITHILTKYIHLVPLGQKLLKTRNSPLIHGWHWPPIGQKSRSCFPSFLLRIKSSFFLDIEQVFPVELQTSAAATQARVLTARAELFLTPLKKLP